MSNAFRRYLIGQGSVGAAVNLVLNAAIAWLLYRSLSSVPIRGSQSIAGDIIATTLLLPFLICVIVTPLVRGEVRNARLPAGEWRGDVHPAVAALPNNTLLRALVLGVISAVIAAPLTIGILTSAGVTAISFPGFVAFKATFAAALAAFVTPVVAARALEDSVSGALEEKSL